MERKILILGVLVMSLAAAGVHAQTAPASTPQASDRRCLGNDLCDHYAFRQGNIDWQLWITTGAKPLPRKIVITNRSDEARPQSVSVIRWDLKPGFTDAAFRFTQPKDASKIEILPVKAK